MAKRYHTVKTAKLVCENADRAARRAIDSAMFLTPETERDIDLALGIGTMDLDGAPVEPVEPVEGGDRQAVDIMVDPGPSADDLAKIEAEQ